MTSLLFVGCGDDDGSGPIDGSTGVDATMGDAGSPDAGSDGGTPISPELEEYLEAFCGYFVRCEAKALGGQDTEPLICHPSRRDRISLLESLANGRTAVDPAAARDCAAELRVLDCDVVGNDDPGGVCGSVFRSLIAPGGMCTSDDDCLGGSCDLTASCPGTCVEFAAMGESCAAVACAPDLRCLAGVCGAPLPLGGDCTSGRECESRYCVDLGINTVCAPQPGMGGACVIPAPPAAGSDPCVDDLICSSGTCVVGVPMGGDCSVDPCAVALRCDALTSTCIPLSPPGGPCTTAENCPRSYVCDASACVPAPVAGESCDVATRPCFTGVCMAGTCELSAAGSTCSENAECMGYCDTTVCAAYVPAGAACSPGDRCAPRHTCDRDSATCVPSCP